MLSPVQSTGQYGTPPVTCTPGQSVPGLDGSAIKLFTLATACIDDLTSDWVGSYGDVSPYNFAPSRTNPNNPIMNGFVHIAYNYAKSGSGSGDMTDDPNGQRAMGYYDQSYLNYYYYMASQFALSDRWFSPVSSKSTPNRLATMTGGTTQGLVYDPFDDDKFTNFQFSTPTIFGKLDKAGVSWKIYYGLTNGGCTDQDGDCGTVDAFPSITFADFTDSYKYLYSPQSGAACSATTTAIGTGANMFCMDTTHIAPIGQYFTDVANGTLPSFAFIEPAYGHNDEHPGSGQSILWGQAEVASLVNKLMATSGMPNDSWKDSVFFLSYDEGGGPFDHVPPVPNYSNISPARQRGSRRTLAFPIFPVSRSTRILRPVTPVGRLTSLVRRMERLLPGPRRRHRPCTATSRTTGTTRTPATMPAMPRRSMDLRLSSASGCRTWSSLRSPGDITFPTFRWITRRS